MEMAPPENTPEMLRYAQVVCARAISTAIMAPAGPVHLNFPLREPLIPLLEDEELFTQKKSEEKLVGIQRATLALQETDYNKYRDMLNSVDKGVIICGGIEEDGFTRCCRIFSQKNSIFPS